MSYLNEQVNAFKSNVTAASSKLSNKRTAVAPTNSTPPPAFTQSSSQNDLKRKRVVQPTAFSQPADTGTGREIGTQIVYAIDYMKEKGRPQTITDIISYLNIHNKSASYKRSVQQILKDDPKVKYDPKNDGGEGTFSYRPIYNIRTADALLGSLQSQPTAQGLGLSELKDGWPDAEAAIDSLEIEGKLLVTRNKKDNHVKKVWLNDPSLDFPVDQEFQSIWHKIKLPESGILADELEKAGFQPANKSRGVKSKVVEQKKKTKKPRKGGKTTNTHMAGVLRDYSHLKK